MPTLELRIVVLVIFWGVDVKLINDELNHVPELFVEKMYWPFECNAILSPHCNWNVHDAPAVVVSVWFNEYVGLVVSTVK